MAISRIMSFKNNVEPRFMNRPDQLVRRRGTPYHSNLSFVNIFLSFFRMSTDAPVVAPPSRWCSRSRRVRGRVRPIWAEKPGRDQLICLTRTRQGLRTQEHVARRTAGEAQQEQARDHPLPQALRGQGGLPPTNPQLSQRAVPLDHRSFPSVNRMLPISISRNSTYRRNRPFGG
jgi:hypothetical protein